MKSNALKHFYKDWLKTAEQAEIELADNIYHICEQNYSAGGDTIVECYTPEEIIEQFKTVDQVKSLIGLKIEQELNARLGEDTDPQLERQRNYENATW